MSNRQENNPNRQQIYSLIRQFDEALAQGASTAPIETDSSRLKQRESEEFEQLCQCVAMLEELHRKDDSGQTDGVNESTEGPNEALAVVDPPRRIGRFEIRGEIGRGGCGVVFRAHDTKLGRDVAIKIPRPEALVSENMRQRFLREARAAGAVDHPNIVPIYEVGEDGPISFIAATYIPGPSLATWLASQRGQIDARQAATLIVTLADALEHAHGRGVVHRDIKPGNILLQPSTSTTDSSNLADYIPKITDFGLAKLFESSDSATRTGSVIGTPLYMSPEQAEGRLDQIGPTTDIYSAGVILFELLTGHPPLRGESDVDTLRRIVSDDAPLVRITRPRVPRDLEAICLKCLEKSPANRYRSGAELSNDLRRFLGGTPTLARPIGTTRRIWRWMKRRPNVAALICVSLLFLTLLLGGGWVYSGRLTVALDNAETERSRAEAERSRAEIEHNRAEVEQHRAESETLVSRQLLYSVEVRLAFDAWKGHNSEQTIELLTHHIPLDGQPDLREFSWHWLWGQCHREVRSFIGHTDEVFCVDFAPDGATLATASKDGTARIWDISTGKVRHVLDDHSDEVICVRFSPDGKMMATGSEDRQVILWDTQSGESLFTLAGHENHVLSVAFSPDGSQLASGGRDDCVQVWDLDKQKVIRVLPEPTRHVRSVRYSPDGETLAACDEGGFIHRWETSDWKHNSSITETSDSLFTMDFHSDSRRLLAGGRNSVLYPWDLEEAVSARFYGNMTDAGWIRDLRIAPNGTTVATANHDGFLRLWDINQEADRDDSALLATVPVHGQRVWSLAWSPDGKQLATASADKSIKLWKPADFLDSSPYETVEGVVWDLAFAEDSKTFATIHQGGKVCRWNVNSPSHVGRQDLGGSARFSSLAIHPSGKYVATASGSTPRVCYLNLTTGDLLFEEVRHQGEVNALDISDDGMLLAVADENRTAKILELPSGKELHVLKHESGVDSVQFSPDGRTLVTCSREIRLWDSRTGDLLWNRRRHESDPRIASFSPDGRLIAAAVDHDKVILVEAADGESRGLLQIDYGGTTSLAFSPDGRTLAAVWEQSSVISLWDVRTRQELGTLNARLAAVHTMAFSPDGSRLLAAGNAKGPQRKRGPKGIGQVVEWVLPETK